MDAKFERLTALLGEHNGLLVAFSAGVDSTFLLKAAQMALSDRAIALTAISPSTPPGEVDAAKEFAESLGCPWRTDWFSTGILDFNSMLFIYSLFRSLRA